MKKLFLFLTFIGGSLAQQSTVFFPVVKNAVGVIPIGVTAIPPSYMIGQYTHTLSITLTNSGGTCNANSLVVGLDGSLDNAAWISLGAPITALTGVPGTIGQLTGMTVNYGAFPFIRMNVRRAFGGNCSTNVNYVGSVVPVSFPTSLSHVGDQYIGTWITNLDISVIGLTSQLQTTPNLGGRISLFGLQITNNDAATAANYTITLFNKGTGACAVGGTGTAEVLFVYRVLAGQTFRLGFSDVPFFAAPNNGATNAGGANASSMSAYDPIAGFYQICITSSVSVLSTVNLVSRIY